MQQRASNRACTGDVKGQSRTYRTPALWSFMPGVALGVNQPGQRFAFTEQSTGVTRVVRVSDLDNPYSGICLCGM